MAEDIFKPIVIDTREVIKELRIVASSNKISMKYIDFNILNIDTYYKTDSQDEWSSLSDGFLEEFSSDKFMRNPDLEIFQQFKIEIFFNDSRQSKTKLPKLLLGANKTLTSVIAKVHKTPNITPSKNLEQMIIDDINKKKIRSGILVGIRQKDMLLEAKRISSYINVNKTLDKDVNFVVMDGLAPVQCVDNKLTFPYQDKIKQMDEHGRVDYAKRGYVHSIKKDEVVIEYRKGKEGKAGRDCRGKYIEVRDPIIKEEFNVSNIKTTENIITKEDEDTIKFIAATDGYVSDENGVYDIGAQIELESADFKSTGAIEAGLDSNTTINIKETDEIKDAIGEGISIETSRLNIEGNVASSATIKAEEVRIGGQTHKTSKIDTKVADIAIHKGELVAKEAAIQRLEGGVIEADIVKIDTAIGGKVIARKIYIQNLKSNVNFTAYEDIDIIKISGSDNKLIIDPTAKKDFNKKNDTITSKIEKLTKECDKIIEQMQTKKSILVRNKLAMEALKEKILELKSNGVKPPATLVLRLKDYQALMVQLDELENTLLKKKEQIQKLKNMLKAYQDEALSAKIVNHSSWTEFNEIYFKTIKPVGELVHHTKKDEIARVFTLGKTQDDILVIKISNEFT